MPVFVEYDVNAIAGCGNADRIRTRIVEIGILYREGKGIAEIQAVGLKGVELAEFDALGTIDMRIRSCLLYTSGRNHQRIVAKRAGNIIIPPKQCIHVNQRSLRRCG